MGEQEQDAGTSGIGQEETIRVRAKGDGDRWVGYYNHIRRRGGDVFVLTPMEIDRNGRKVVISARQQFSSRWMEEVPTSVPETRPAHFNQIGRGRARGDTGETRTPTSVI